MVYVYDYPILHLRMKVTPRQSRHWTTGSNPAEHSLGHTACPAKLAMWQHNALSLQAEGEKGAESHRPSPKLTHQMSHLPTHLPLLHRPPQNNEKEKKKKIPGTHLLEWLKF